MKKTFQINVIKARGTGWHVEPIAIINGLKRRIAYDLYDDILSANAAIEDYLAAFERRGFISA